MIPQPVSFPVCAKAHQRCLLGFFFGFFQMGDFSHHCIVKWWGGPSSKNGVTWPRFVRVTDRQTDNAFCLVSSQKWSVLYVCTF